MKSFKIYLILVFVISSIKLDAQSINIGDNAPELAFKNPTYNETLNNQTDCFSCPRTCRVL